MKRTWKIRRASLEDIPQLMEVDRKVWSNITRDDLLWEHKHFTHQIKVAGDFYFVAVDTVNDKILGYCTIMPMAIARDELENHFTTWEDLSSGGWYERIDPSGNAGYGVSLAVLPEATKRGIGDRLVAREFAETVRHGMEYGFLGGRLPGLRDWLDQHPDGTAEKYFNFRRPDGQYYDPELRLYARDMEIVKLIPGYFPDPESCNFGVLIVWKNPMPRWLPRGVNYILFRAMLGALQIYEWLRPFKN